MTSIAKCALPCVVLILLITGCKKKTEAMPEMLLPAAAVKVVKTDLPWTLTYPAQAAGSLAVQVRAQVGGILKARLYQEGAYIKQGQQLFQIDDAPYKIALQQAQASLAQAQSNEGKANRDFERMKVLRPQNAVSQKDYDDALGTYEAAKASTQIAKAQVNNADINLGYTQVNTPIAGISGDSVQSVGSLIAPNGPSGLLTTIAQINPLYINFSMPTEDFTKLAGGFVNGTIIASATAQAPITVEVTLPDGAAYPYVGRIIFFASEESQNSASIAVKAALPNPHNQRLLLPGQFIRAHIKGAVYKDAVIIPSGALLATPAGDIVFMIKEDNTIEIRPIKAYLQQGVYIVTEGLKGGEIIVSQGLIKLNPGQKVMPEVKAFNIPAKTVRPAQKAIEIPAIPGMPIDGAPMDIIIKDANTSIIPLVSATTEVILPGTQIDQQAKEPQGQGN